MPLPVLPESVNRRLFFPMCAVMCLFFGGLTAGVSTLFFPLAAAAFSVLFFFEEKRIYSFIAPVALTALCILFGLSGVVSAVGCIAFALVFFLFYKRGAQKFDAAMLLVAVLFLGMILQLYFDGAAACGAWDMPSVTAYYKGLYDTSRQGFKDSFDSMMVNTGISQSVSDETVFAVFDAIVFSLPSVFAVYAFLLVGLAFKLSSAVLSFYDVGGGASLKRWSFKSPLFLAYAYLLLFVLYLFVGTADSVFGSVVSDLYYIFLVIFAYIGWKFYLFFTARKKKKKWTVVLLILGILLFSLYALEILSAVGAFAVILAARMQKGRQNGNPEGA